MAELIFKDMVKEEGVESSFCITSFGTSDEEEGNPIYPPAKRTLISHGIAGSHTAKQLSLKDVKNNDYVLVMDGRNLLDVMHLTGGEYSEKVFRLCSFTDNDRDVADPWYTRDFERAFADIRDGCKAFLEFVLKEKSELIKYNNRH